MAKAGCLFLCMCLCFGFVFCQFGFPSYGPEEYQHDRQQSFGDNIYSPDPNNVQNVPGRLSGVLHLRPDETESSFQRSQFIYPFNEGSPYTEYGNYRRPNLYNVPNYHEKLGQQSFHRHFEGNGQYWSHGRPNEYPTDYAPTQNQGFEPRERQPQFYNPYERPYQYFGPPDSVYVDNDSKEADFQANRPNGVIFKDTLNKEVQSQFPAFDKRGSEIEYEDNANFGPVNSGTVKGFATDKPQELNPNLPEMKLPVQKYDGTREEKKLSGSGNYADGFIFPDSDDGHKKKTDNLKANETEDRNNSEGKGLIIIVAKDDEIELPDGMSPATIPELTPMSTSLPEITPVPDHLPGFTLAPSSVLNRIPTRLPELTTVPTSLPELTPVPTSLPELTPVPTSLPELNPVPKTESRKDFNFNSFRENCQTADNGVGSCISIYDCRPYLSLLQDAQANPGALNTLRKAHCGFEGNKPKVCCPRSSIPTALPPVETTTPAPTTTSTPPSTTAQGTVKMPGDKDFNMFPLPPECGLSNASFSRVVNGVPAKLGDFPWMALLGYQGRRNPGARWLCGGSLITAKHVLTAAHCIHGHEQDLYIVRLGELDLAREDEGATPVDVPIKQKVMHEEYSAKAFTNDVGLLVLQRVVEFTALIRPICIPFDSTLRARSFEKYNPLIAGWGDTEFRGPSATHLQVLQLPVVSNAYCAERYSTYKAQTIDERVLCAGYKRGGKDACQGDSGGPLMQPIWNQDTATTFFYQIGVVSFGKKCAEPDFPGVYTRVTHFVPWIQENVIKTSEV